MKIDSLDIDLGPLKAQIVSLDPAKHHIVHVRVGDSTFVPTHEDLQKVAALFQEECDAAKLNVSVFATATAVEIDILEV